MRIRIHRGAAEIGGNSIEVESQGKTMLLDLGLPLNASEPDPRLLPRVPGLTDATDRNFLGVVLSHPHVDHYGLLAAVSKDIPVYLGRNAIKLLNAASPFLIDRPIPQEAVAYDSSCPFHVGPFRITPILVDHSAFDAHALLVEADGKRILYSGDFRGHGRKAHLFNALLKTPPRDIDVLLLEGTTLGRDGDDTITESELENDMMASIRDTRGLVLVCFSAQNIDRIVTVLRACKRSSRTLIVDAYTACILAGVDLKTLPSPSSPISGMQVFLPHSQKLKIVRSSRFDLIEPFRGNRIFLSRIERAPSRFVMMFRASMARDLNRIGNLGGGLLIYSLWPGYLERDRFDLRSWCNEKGLRLQVHHTSGHATPTDLASFATAIAPKRVIPIHTMHPSTYQSLMPNVMIASNGEWVSV